MEIARATTDDWPELNRIYRDVRRRHFHWLPDERIGNDDLGRDTVGEALYVAREHGAVLGFIAVWPPDRFIHHLYVDGAHQGRGVGSRLLDFVRRTYPAPLRLKCVAQNERARCFYLRRGWRVVGGGVDVDGNYLLIESPPDSTLHAAPASAPSAT